MSQAVNDQATLDNNCPETVPPGVRSYHERTNGYVYFISDGDAVKIGFSAMPESRMFDLQASTPRALKMLARFPGTMANEQDLHSKFRDLRLRGEWFKLDRQVLGLIDVLKKGLKMSEAIRTEIIEPKIEVPPSPFGPWRFPLEQKQFRRWLKKKTFAGDWPIRAGLVGWDINILKNVSYIETIANSATARFNELDAHIGALDRIESGAPENG